jgi:hypothetical protein
MTRFKIARGAVNRIGPILAVFLVVVGIWVGGLFALLAAGANARSALTIWPAGLIVIVAALLVYMNLPGWLDLGDDGVLVDFRGSKRFVAFNDLEDAPVYRESSMGKRFVGVALDLLSGERVKVPIGEDQFGAGERASLLSESICAALEKHRRGMIADDASALARGERSAGVWAARLRGLGEGANAGPREAPIDQERLFRIAENPGAEPELRAGAAAALSTRLDDEGRKRLRIAAEGTASPEVKGALAAAADGDEEAVVAALERVKG